MSDFEIFCFACRKNNEPAIGKARLFPCVRAILLERFVRRQGTSWAQKRLQAQVGMILRFGFFFFFFALNGDNKAYSGLCVANRVWCQHDQNLFVYLMRSIH